VAYITITVQLTQEYGHPDNRPSDSAALKAVHDELDKICERAADQGRQKNGLAHYYVTAIAVTH